MLVAVALVLGTGALVPGTGALVPCAGALVPGAGALVLGAGALVLGAGALVLGAGVLVPGTSALVLGAGVLVPGAGALVLGAGLLVPVTGALMLGARAAFLLTHERLYLVLGVLQKGLLAPHSPSSSLDETSNTSFFTPSLVNGLTSWSQPLLANCMRGVQRFGGDGETSVSDSELLGSASAIVFDDALGSPSITVLTSTILVAHSYALMPKSRCSKLMPKP